MVRVEIKIDQVIKDKLQAIAKEDNRTMTSMIIKLIEDRYKIIGGK